MDGFLVCEEHGDVLWDPGTEGSIVAGRILPASDLVDPGYRPREYDVIKCPVPGCARWLRAELRKSVKVIA